MDSQDIKITGASSYIDVAIGGKTIRISGEMTTGGFLAYKDAIRNWNSPEIRPVTDEERQTIIDAVTAKTAGSHMVITFEA